MWAKIATPRPRQRNTASNLKHTTDMKEADKDNHEIITPSTMIDGSRNSQTRQRKRVQKRVSLGICIICKKDNPRKAQKCKSCTDKAVASNKRRFQTLAKNSQCIKCSTAWSGNTLICPKCRIEINQKWKDKDSTQFCFRCAAPRDTEHKSCSSCRMEMRKNSDVRRSNSHAGGFCVQCRTKRDTDQGKYCTTCIFKTASRRWLEDSDRWNELKILFESQCGKCAYTDAALTIGGNASMDHKNPRSKGGRDSIENLHWVDWKINRMKTDIPHEEFISICSFIGEKFRQLKPTTPPASPSHDASQDEHTAPLLAPC